MPRHRPRGRAPLAAALAFLGACAPSEAATEPQDAAFEALQARGEAAMGVDQYTSTHRFDALADGGRIELQRDVDDPEGVAAIRTHLSGLAQAFASGDFATPGFVHAQDVPGTAVMAARSERIEYVYGDLPRGGELRLVTSDPDALAAIHEFMAFQQEEHHAGGSHQPSVDHGSTDRHSALRALHGGGHGRGNAP
jgi:hypothetical protein